MASKHLKRTPIREQDRPLRLPGESLQDRIHERKLDFMGDVGMLLAMGTAAFISAWTWIFKLPIYSMTIVATLAFLGMCLYYLPKIRKAKKEMDAMRLGLQGERVVADILDEIKVGGGYVLHDLVGGDFNIDHVLLTRQGVFVIETKTWSKYVGKDQKIYYDGETVKVESFSPPKNPTLQAKANAKWIGDLLKASTGKSYPVRPVVVFPGWYVNLVEGSKKAEVWVLSPKMLSGFIKAEDKRLEANEVSLALQHLKTFSRTKQKTEIQK